MTDEQKQDLTPAEAHAEDDCSFENLNRVLKQHIKDNKTQGKVVTNTLALLMPLAELIEPLQNMIEEKRANVIVAAKFMKIVGIAAANYYILASTPQVGLSSIFFLHDREEGQIILDNNLL